MFHEHRFQRTRDCSCSSHLAIIRGVSIWSTFLDLLNTHGAVTVIVEVTSYGVKVFVLVAVDCGAVTVAVTVSVTGGLVAVSQIADVVEVMVVVVTTAAGVTVEQVGAAVAVAVLMTVLKHDNISIQSASAQHWTLSWPASGIAQCHVSTAKSSV